jgi:hypothetical protein
MRTLTTIAGPLVTVAAASVATTQSVTAPGALALVSSPVVFANPARVTITGGDTGAVYRIEGRDRNGRTFGESLIGAGSSVNLYTAVTAVYCDRAMAATVTVGNDNGGASEPIRLDEWADPPIGVQVSVSGTANFTVQHSLDDPNDTVSPVPWASMMWDTSLVPALAVGGVTSLSFAVPIAPMWMRILLNSGTGSARMTVSQYNTVEM